MTYLLGISAYYHDSAAAIIKDGTIIDLNYGNGKADNYVYINGYWFKTSKNANYDYKNYKTLYTTDLATKKMNNITKLLKG